MHTSLNAHSPMKRYLPRKTRLILDITLVLAITLTLAYLATHVNAMGVTRLTDTLSRNNTANQEDPILRSAQLEPIADLISDLKSPNSSVRANAAIVLGSKHAIGATDALLAATYDSNSRVREKAAAALGNIGAIQALPRLKELQITSGETPIETAAFESETKIAETVAATIHVPFSSLQVLTVAQNGIAYASAENKLYALQDGMWYLVGQLPATLNDLSAGPDGRLIYLSSLSQGLYRSQDGGNTWEHSQFGTQTPTQLETTAVVVNPENTNQVFVALAVKGSNGDKLNSVGIAESQDGGKTWLELENSPIESVTRMLVIDRTTQRYLYGLSDVGSWRYDLVSDGSTS